MHLEPRKRHLFLFAHPDDDTFIAGTMRLLLKAGAEVHAAWLTSGGYFAFDKKRKTELRMAMDELGLSEDFMHLLGFTDLGLIADLPAVVDRATQLFEQLQPERVFVTAYEGGHPDHDAVNFSATEAKNRTGSQAEIFEFPLYNGSGPRRHWRWRINRFPHDGLEVLHNPLNQDAIRCKHRMMRIYSSQWMYMIPLRLATKPSWLRQVGEPFRRVPHDRDYSLPPHPGKPNYERWFNSFMNMNFNEFKTAVDKCRANY